MDLIVHLMYIPIIEVMILIIYDTLRDIVNRDIYAWYDIYIYIYTYIYIYIVCIHIL